jgi:hypothetical protein
MSSAKSAIYPNSLIHEREVSSFLRKKEGWRTYQLVWGTYPSRRRRRWKLDSPDNAMARV